MQFQSLLKGLLRGLIPAAVALGTYEAQAESPIAGLPGLQFKAAEAFSPTCTIGRYSGVLKDPTGLGGGSLALLNHEILICLNPDVLNNNAPISEIMGMVWNGGYGWNLSPANLGSMPGFLLFIRNQFFTKFGGRLGIIVAPLLEHMSGGSGASTGASINNARLDALGILILRNLGIDSSRTILAGFSRGGETSIGTSARYPGNACSTIDISGSYNNGQSTPTPSMIDSLSVLTPLNLFACASGDSWAQPYIGNLHSYRLNQRAGGALPGTYIAAPCNGHDAALADATNLAAIEEAIRHDCGSGNFSGAVSHEQNLPSLRKLSPKERKALKLKARKKISARKVALPE